MEIIEVIQILADIAVENPKREVFVEINGTKVDITNIDVDCVDEVVIESK